MADQYYGHHNMRTSLGSPMTKENIPNNQLVGGGYKEESSHKKAKKRKANDELPRESGKEEAQVNWEKLYKALEAERVTKAESLLYAYRQESEERERLMRGYNQELEQDNKRLKRDVSNVAHQKQEIHNLQQQVQDLKAVVGKQKAQLRVYQAFTGATLSNLPLPSVHYDRTNGENDKENKENEALDCDCTVTNPDTKVATTFRLSTVEMPNTQQQQPKEQSDQPNSNSGVPLLKYTPLENAKPLPSFLQEEIEFERSQLPPLLQNILRGIFPEEE